MGRQGFVLGNFKYFIIQGYCWPHITLYEKLYKLCSLNIFWTSGEQVPN